MSRWAAAAALVAAAGCSSAGPAPPGAMPAAAPPPAVTPAAPPAREPEPPPPAPAEAPADDGVTTVLEIPTVEPSAAVPRDLVAAAAAERRRREQAGPATVVIDQDSLSDYAGVEITIAEAAAPVTVPGGEGEGTEAAADRIRDEAYWRARVREIRERWREAHDSIERLEGEIDQLRRRFYAEDDPFYRDSQIKPAWDHALEEARLARLEVERARAELQTALEEGRRAGADPGWLREGVDLQPEKPRPLEADSLQVEETGIHEPEEPTVRERRDGGGGETP
ncbi:MAG: hypothetical protein R3325_05115 [Thermoanaerobaculia bacterium]|nr:hypothetical protein [Thermoanaerobaculia bacterium]